MSSLAEFLKKEAVEQRSRYKEVAADVQVWQKSVLDLVNRIEDRLKVADEVQILRIDRTSQIMREEGIGLYSISGLSIGLGSRQVELRPIARHIAARFEEGPAPASKAQGRVDLTNGSEKALLFRFVVDGEDRWMIADDRDYRLTPFDPESFDRTMQRLLS